MPRNFASGASVNSNVMTADHADARITPVSNRRGDASIALDASALARSLRAKPKTIAIDTIAPAKAPASINNEPAPSSIVPSAPAAAPPDTPSTYGSARGLRSNTCINAPATASNPPVANAARARGRRSCRTTSTFVESPCDSNACNTSSGAIDVLPIDSATTNAMRATTASTSQMRQARASGCRWPALACMASLLITLEPITDCVRIRRYCAA